jgi:hypothetical protein
MFSTNVPNNQIPRREFCKRGATLCALALTRTAFGFAQADAKTKSKEKHMEIKGSDHKHLPRGRRIGLPEPFASIRCSLRLTRHSSLVPA